MSFQKTSNVRKGSMAAHLAMLPAWIIVLAAYLWTVAWTLRLSFSSSRSYPVSDWVGLDQYTRLFRTTRWLASIENVALFGICFVVASLVLGFLLAVVLDSRMRAEGVLRTVYLYPHAMSFIVTGLVWQWMFNPALGIQKTVRGLGWEGFTLDWLTNSDTAIYVVVLAAVWQAVGVITALMLAGLRGIDQDIWKAAKVEGIKTWRVYVSIVLPMLSGTIATCVVLLAIGVLKSYDLVVALTNGGPGMSTEVPAKFAMEYLFTRQNLGLATAATVVMLMSIIAILAPWYLSTKLNTRR